MKFSSLFLISSNKTWQSRSGVMKFIHTLKVTKGWVMVWDKTWTGLDWIGKNMDWINKTWINKTWSDKT